MKERGRERERESKDLDVNNAVLTFLREREKKKYENVRERIVREERKLRER